MTNRSLESFMVKLFDMALDAMDKYFETGKRKFLNKSILLSKGLNDVYEAETKADRLGYEEHG